MNYINYLFHGRAGQIQDVIIDSLGVMLGIAVADLIIKIIGRRKKYE